MSDYNENYGIVYHSDDDTFDIKDFNENFSKVADELENIEDSVKGKSDTGHIHILSSNDIKGALPLNKGGTGATTAANARASLELGNAAIKTYTNTVTSGSSNLVTSGGVYTAIANLKLGTASTKPYTGSVVSGSTSLVTSGGVYTAIANLKLGTASTKPYTDTVTKGSTSLVTSGGVDTAITNLKLGTASTKPYTDTVTKGSTSLVTSGGVYTALEKKQGKYCYLVAVNSYAKDCDDTYINAADYVFECPSGYASVSGLNRFLDSLPEGSKVVFAPGSYLIKDTIQIDTRLCIEGLNHRATFFTTSDVPMLNIGNGTEQANNVTVRNLYFRKWDYTNMPPTEGTKSDNVYTTPIITVTKGNGVYIEKCGLYNHSTSYNSSKGYNSIIKYNDYALNSIVEKCVFNTNVSSLTNNGKVVGFAIDMSGCNTSVKSSIKFIANFGSATYFKPKAISSYETTFIGCTGVKEYNEDSTAVNALTEEEMANDSTEF